MFDHSMSFLDGAMEAPKALDNWKVKAVVDETVVIDSSIFASIARKAEPKGSVFSINL